MSAFQFVGLFSFLAAVALTFSQGKAAYPFYMGGDISLESFMQQESITYKDGGVATPMDQILYDHGANLYRIRVFVTPATTYTNTGPGYPNLNPNYGAIQTTAYDIALAQQIKAHAPDAKILLDLQYSDTWADPGKQYKPAAVSGGLQWASDTTQAQLNSDVQTYTHDTLMAFKNAGVMPDMVQIGNETTNGMLWQTGTTIGQGGAAGVGGKLLYTGTQQNLSWQNFGGLLNAAIAGVRQVQGAGPRIPVALSIDSGDKNGLPQYFYGNIQSPSLGNVTDFDVMGVDYYPSSNDSNKSFSFLQSNLTALANTNYTANPANPKRIMILETNYPFTPHSGIGISTWPSTQAGQKAEFVAVTNLIRNLPHNVGEGVLYWNPEGVLDSNYSQGWYNGGATALFDVTSNHNALQLITDNTFAPTRGDFNGDGQFTSADLPAMLAALTDPDKFKSDAGLTSPDLRLLGDFNNDQVVNNADIQGMLQALITGSSADPPSAVPEPSSICLIAIAASIMAVMTYMQHFRRLETHPS
jgi:arabinogalactan endo-1,4-beta-galactosidase